MKKYTNFLVGMGNVLELFPSEKILLHRTLSKEKETDLIDSCLEQHYLISIKCNIYRDWSNVNNDFDRIINGNKTKHGSLKSICD